MNCYKKLSCVRIVVLLLAAAPLFGASSKLPQIVPARLTINGCNDCYIPYIANYPLHQRNNNIKHVILAIHSSSYDARRVFNNCLSLLRTEPREKNTTLVIAPQFLMNEKVKFADKPNLLFWTVEPFRGSARSTTAGCDKNLNISAFTILENIISSVADRKAFPNLEKITILGHSAGGQFVNRFAASNTVEFDVLRPAGIKCRYIVMNPSSYVYLSPKRYVPARGVFAVPEPNQIKDDPGYNHYGYGLEELYVYHKAKGLTAEKIRQMYPQRDIVYMLGEKDHVADATMSISASAMLQGSNRLERGRTYYGHLLDEFGPEIRTTQKLVVVPGAGHSDRQMMLSEQGRLYILKH